MDESKNMCRVLVISHNVFCNTSSMGKTLSEYFKNWETNKLAQFYIHSEVPTSSICENYYRITDKEIIKSICTRKSGCTFSKSDIQLGRLNTRTDEGTTAQIYQYARKRTPMIYILRNLAWLLGCWNTKKFKNWIVNFHPDVIFFASGDYSFLYRIARKLAQNYNIPIIISCMDDYYLNNKNKRSLIGKFQHSMFMHEVKKTMNHAASILTICDKMSNDYQSLFQKKCYTLHTPSQFSEPLCFKKTNAISYIGNLSNDRYKQLIKIGKALKELNIENGPTYVDVYSEESRSEILNELTLENGICFHGYIGADEVEKVMGSSLALIHTESFDQDISNLVKYSVSTKIADSLASGTCIFAFGPKDIASIDYLYMNQSAIVANSDQELKEQLELLITDSNTRHIVEQNALYLAKKNHDSYANTELIRKVLCKK